MRPARARVLGRVLVAGGFAALAFACTEGVTPDCSTGSACAPFTLVDAGPFDASADAGEAGTERDAGDAG